jgi:hypothetical protein
LIVMSWLVARQLLQVRAGYNQLQPLFVTNRQGIALRPIGPFQKFNERSLGSTTEVGRNLRGVRLTPKKEPTMVIARLRSVLSNGMVRADHWPDMLRGLKIGSMSLFILTVCDGPRPSLT